MKKLLLIIALAFIAFHFADAQEIKLVADKTFGVGNNWDKIFDSYYDTRKDGFSIGLRKHLVIYDGGKAIVSHYMKNRYSLFDANGKFLKDIVLHYADKSRKLRSIEPVGGRIGNLFYTLADNMGNIYFFDDNGLIVKELKIKYQSLEMLTLDDSHIAIYGGCSWPKKYRHFVSILNVKTGKDKIICDAFHEYLTSSNDSEYCVLSEDRKNGIGAEFQIAKINGQLIVSSPLDGLIRFYDYDGNKISEKKMDWQPTMLSVEEQKEMQSEIIQYYREEIANLKRTPTQNNAERMIRIYEKMKAQYEEGMKHITEPIEIGYFSIVIQGVDDNILYFVDAKESGKNLCHAYSVNKGKSIKQITFTSDEYDLAITKKRFVFFNGNLYGVQELKDYDGMPLRLVRFELK